MDGKTKNGEISNNLDNARVTHWLAQGNLCRDVKCCQVHLNPDFIRSLAHFSDFSGSFASRQQQLPWTRRKVYGQHFTARTHAHSFSLRTPHVITRLARGPDDSLCVWKSHYIFGHIFVECSFDPDSSCLLTVHYLTDATDWNQTKPVCDSALGWTVWPSGRSDSKHIVWLESETCSRACRRRLGITGSSCSRFENCRRQLGLWWWSISSGIAGCTCTSFGTANLEASRVVVDQDEPHGNM